MKFSPRVRVPRANPGNEPIVLKRVLRRKGSNECYINNQHVSWERYLMEIKDLNIMADNLVQFLPQERVIDFSLMSAIQLLENTEKTVRIYDYFACFGPMEPTIAVTRFRFRLGM